MFDELELIEVFATNGDGTIGFAHHDENGDWHDCEPIQFTGLHDKNGKEIYGGDVMSCGNGKGQVKYANGRYIIDMIYEGYDNIKDKEIATFNLYTAVSGLAEVIGNIYENPELINP